jgi:hypothetical protein
MRDKSLEMTVYQVCHMENWSRGQRSEPGKPSSKKAK